MQDEGRAPGCTRIFLPVELLDGDTEPHVLYQHTKDKREVCCHLDYAGN